MKMFKNINILMMYAMLVVMLINSSRSHGCPAIAAHHRPMSFSELLFIRSLGLWGDARNMSALAILPIYQSRMCSDSCLDVSTL
jgi:hypothetical protein